MTLAEKIASDFKGAMKTGDTVRRSVLSLLKAALHNKAIEKRKKDVPFSDEEIVEVVAAEIKKRKDAAEQYKAAGRDELSRKEEAELTVLMGYMPPQLPENEIRVLVADAIAKTGAAGQKDMGKVLGFLSKQMKGRADMSLVAQIVKENLSR